MSLWVDKHRPRSLQNLHYHKDLSDRLAALASNPDFPHLLVYGPSGAGKKTRIVATLKELYGPGVEKLKIDQRIFVTPSNRKLEVNIVSSVYHQEITPSDVGNYDRVVVQDLLKEVAQTQQVDLSAKQRFKVVVINEADALTREAQAALRRTMEKYTPNLRLILLCNSTSKIISPIRSRCLLIRVAAPSHDEIVGVLRHVAEMERVEVGEGLLRKVAEESGRNLRRAVLMLEAAYAQSPGGGALTDANAVLTKPDWELFIASVASSILAEQSPSRLLSVRAQLYDLLTHCIPASTILKTLLLRLLEGLDEELKVEVVKWAAFYEHRLRLGNKAIFHLEAFVARVMRIQAGYLMGFGDDF
ncbi:P-loop containing nucleoside triphosphate hydrolase protein [Saitoella complicata NRRL Y-17804]|uniref:Replication factor C subunit 5 n=1 Tax=Saitoella complicata (strain BCRC 22490 / CBS 7301 / JCM 7358 / NBRC 10748 / NRRL Y-17804) TaxID=698492 RepID=A0A0E9NDS2_SAICN|nr:P-loop containing nucleoside triphosphate hydrolase protein [Saitoella complicata NRRL Y-17804]ODQ50700.1 P-loop containing nucleoside triphosphate hydrolase protein [Saitoella complicata NRRL Y-17804]GAO47953.1 hypothetical protein G7K_2147-t1 [Saitoella complicata NRRL Y-17804]